MEVTEPNILTIVIPALNEEAAIADIIQRCLRARDSIIQESGIDEIEIFVVSDGSTDRTAEIAQTFEDRGVQVIVFESNRGYGAAIKEGFRQGCGNYVAFLDADGTCDPLYFGPLTRLVHRDGMDMTLGSRLGPDSKMPSIRRLGNRIFAAMLGFLCGQFIVDTASGMRVLRREAHDRMLPLPDRLHYTPAMSTSALFLNLKVVELPMRYEERVGRSKLSVVRDGIRFTQTILAGALRFRPDRLFFLGILPCLALALLMGAYPVEFYFSHGQIPDWMIYRFTGCFLLSSIALQCLTLGVLAYQTGKLALPQNGAPAFWPTFLAEFLASRAHAVLAGLLLLGCVVLLAPGLLDYATTGHFTTHWSRVMVACMGIVTAVQTTMISLMISVTGVWLTARTSAAPPASARRIAPTQTAIRQAA